MWASAVDEVHGSLPRGEADGAHVLAPHVDLSVRREELGDLGLDKLPKSHEIVPRVIFVEALESNL